ncbi:N-acetylmuramoyl-L-alanine amidase [Benzoatithermus flavus]|uniref:N-acetylmuramoyl-L-alanine amidase n=1 Tax=Benzoatithermus flavus TaxID=3108223 RepID=A0ABU8XQE3_9PROT
MLSPNWNERPAGAPIDMLVLHYTGMPTAAAALRRLCDPAAEVSAHYLVDEDGTVTALVPEEKRAWHAGASWWQGRANLNDVSIGIELVNPGHAWGYRPFPAAQMRAVAALARDILGRRPIPPSRVVAHSDIAPTRKEDPGELFDWAFLARTGVGLWPEAAGEAEPEPARAAACLARIGYPLAPQGVPFAAALAAFQRRFRPACCDGRLDPATMGRLLAVAALCEAGPAIT